MELDLDSVRGEAGGGCDVNRSEVVEGIDSDGRIGVSGGETGGEEDCVDWQWRKKNRRRPVTNVRDVVAGTKT